MPGEVVGMPQDISSQDSSPASSGTRRFWPQTALGWASLFLTVIAFACLAIFPVITVHYRKTYPVVDTWVMPAAAAVLLDLAAVLNVVSFWRCHDRTLLVIAAMTATLVFGAFITIFLVGEGLAGT